MTVIWDRDTDDVTESWRDRRVLLREERQAMADADGACGTPGCDQCNGRVLLCEGCNEPCTPQDFTQFDGHGPDCPHGDPECQLRVCDGVHADPTSHSVCETQAERDGRDAVEAAEAGRERWAEWHAEDGL